MASHFYISGFTPSCYIKKHRLVEAPRRFLFSSECVAKGNGRIGVRVSSSSDGGDSYLGMWRKAMDKERKEMKIAIAAGKEEEESLETKSSEFLKILQVPTEERDRVQRTQVIDRAAAAIAVVSTLLREEEKMNNSYLDNNNGDDEEGLDAIIGDQQQQGSAGTGTPGPNFWSWVPPADSNVDDGAESAPSRKTSTSLSQPNPVMELEPSSSYLPLPFESNYLPPFQSLMEVEKEDSVLEENPPQLREENEVDNLFSTHAQDAAHALAQVVDPVSCEGTNAQGSKWWKETGTEVRPDGVVCKWTLTRVVSADKTVEWEEKYWEAADDLGYKELGSEKSGRDVAGNVWREFWKESMSQIEGCLHIEKTADKWGKNGKGDEWQEKWFEHYGAGQTDKWAHKWCTIDPTTHLEPGHAHVWHERWGETYDGQGGSVKYTDKWAERSEGDGWTKWGDKWDEHFDPNGHGVKQGETWWEGKHGERWNKTWGEGHNGSGWVHKYGKSSSGEHWDTHVQQDTWYERYPHYGFYHCFENSVPLRQVKKPSD